MSLTKTYDELSEYAFKRSKKAYSEPSVLEYTFIDIGTLSDTSLPHL